MKKYLSVSALFLFLFIASPVRADILPEGQEQIPVCVKLTDIDFIFEKYYYLSVDVLPSKEIVINEIKPDECIKGYYKLAEHKNFAVKKTDFPTVDFSSIKGFEDERLYEFGTSLPNDHLLVTAPSPLKEIEMEYHVTGINRDSDEKGHGEFFKFSQKTVFKDGGIHSIQWNYPDKSVADEDIPEHIFTDVTPKSQDAKAILYLKENGYVNGYDDGSFKPLNNIVRSEFAKITVNAFKGPDFSTGCVEKNIKPEYKYVYFTDILKGLWYSDYVCAAKKEAIISGYPDGTFQPSKPINFAEGYKIVLMARIGAKFFDENKGLNWYDTYFDFASKILGLNTSNIVPGKEMTRGDMANLIYQIDVREPAKDLENPLN